MINAVIYARYSSDNQREESIEGQIRECMEYARHHNLNVIENYIDRALSVRTDDRPDFQRMIKDSAKGRFEIVLSGNWTVLLATVMTAPIINIFSKRTASG